MPDPLQDRFEVVVGGDTYVFRIPTIRYDMEVGYRAADVRRRSFPEGAGQMVGLDFQAVNFSRYCAYLELYLLKSSTLWPFGFATDDPAQIDWNKAAPPVDFEKFPPSRREDVYLVGDAFEREVARFLSRGDTGRPSAGE